MAQRAKDGTIKKGSLFDDLSFAQVIAGALAAVTSMLLASQIGIYGSVIGVGVGSVVSAIASQLYKKFLLRSANKLRDLHPGETQDTDTDVKGAQGDVQGRASGGSQAAATVQFGAVGMAVPPSPSSDSWTPGALGTPLGGGGVVRRARAERVRKKKFKRAVVLMSIVSALLAVVVSAFVIDFVSAGQGVGVKTDPILPSHNQPVKDEPASFTKKEAPSGSPSSDTKDSASKEPSKEPNKDTSGDKDAPGSHTGPGADSGSGAGSGSGSGSGDHGSADPGSGSGGSTDPGGSSGGGSGSGGAGTGGNKPDAGSGSGSGSGGGTGGASGSTASGSGAAGSTTHAGAHGTSRAPRPTTSVA